MEERWIDQYGTLSIEISGWGWAWVAAMFAVMLLIRAVRSRRASTNLEQWINLLPCTTLGVSLLWGLSGFFCGLLIAILLAFVLFVVFPHNPGPNALDRGR